MQRIGTAKRTRTAVGLVALGLTLWGCGRPGGAGAPAAAVGTVAFTAAQKGYVSPPRILKLTARSGGGVAVTGQADPDARIRAVSSDNGAVGVTTGGDGGFTLDIPPARHAELVALSVESAHRSTPAQGWLFLPPEAPVGAVLLRPGAGARAFAGASLFATVDYDAGGGVALAGLAKPNTPVEAAAETGEPQTTRADAEGRWSLRLTTPLSPGVHVLHVRSAGTSVDRTVTLAARKPNGVFEAARGADGWRIDWTPPGGAQTTLVFAPAGKAGRS